MNTKINRLNDIFFKNLLGNEQRKNLTLNFLNAILNKNENNYFTDIHFMDKETVPIIESGKNSVLDIRAVLNDKTQVNIEVQIAKQSFMQKRSLYYWSKMYSSQLKSGQEYKSLNPAITINLLDFSLLPYNTYHNLYHIKNDETNDILLNDLEMHFIELPKFSLGDIRKLRASDKWIAYFSNKCTDEELEEIAMNEPAIKEALNYESYFTQDDLLLRKYEIQEKATRDYISGMSSAKEEGIQLGIQQGIQQGIQERNKTIAIKMLKRGTDVNIIAEDTDLSVEAILQLKQLHNL